jgi:hypothetical protein
MYHSRGVFDSFGIQKFCTRHDTRTQKTRQRLGTAMPNLDWFNQANKQKKHHQKNWYRYAIGCTNHFLPMAQMAVGTALPKCKIGRKQKQLNHMTKP